MASSSSRRSCSFLTLLLSFFSFILFLLSLASLAPTITLRMPPTSLGWAFLMISGVSLLSSLIGFYSNLTQFCFITHVSLVVASAIGQLLGILALFTKERSSIEMLKPRRDPREAKVLVRMECGILMAMFMMQLGALLLSCVVHSCCRVTEYEGTAMSLADREAAARKRQQKIARIREESMAKTAKIAEVKTREFDEKMNNKYGKWINT